MVDTLFGVETPTRGLSSGKVQSLLTVNPRIVKLRYAETSTLRALADLLPSAYFLLRPEAEGVNTYEMVRYADEWALAATQAGVIDRVLAYEVANEPNHPRLRISPNDWSPQFEQAWYILESLPLPYCSPGLVPHVDIADWRAMLDQHADRWAYRGIHCYFQGEGPSVGAYVALLQAARTELDRVLCTEFNVGNPWGPDVDRVELARQAALELALKGIAGAVLFCHDGGDHPDTMVYTPEEQASICAVGG